MIDYLNQIICGDNVEVMRQMPDNSVDAIATDPPYEIGFMGKKWDRSGIAYNVGLWRECLRVLKPGGHMLAFGGTRTYHRMACAIEDAGFEIRDQLQWLYGSGFPKSLDIGKAVDKLQGNERETVGKNPNHRTMKEINCMVGEPHSGEGNLTIGNSEWEGWGTALKPANEPICLARKPLSEKTVAANVLKWGTGGINIDAGRIATGDNTGRPRYNKPGFIRFGGYNYYVSQSHPNGRFPANVLFDDDAAAELGEMKRYFYCAKASRKERNAGLERLPVMSAGEMTGGRKEGSAGLDSPRAGAGRTSGGQNFHPTVKPIALMEYLIKLITPPDGVILDPFAGSGTTVMAARKLGFAAVGIEISEEYCDIARKRVEETRVHPLHS